MKRYFKRNDTTKGLKLVTLLAIGVIAAGVLGYMVIEGWSFFDSLYMTVITVATIGYGEVNPLSTSGRIFTMCLILAGVGTAGYAVAQITSAVVEGELLYSRRKKQMERRIDSFRGHTIVCGFGRLANLVVKELILANKQLVVIEANEERAAQARDMGAPYVIGSAYEDETLRAAKIDTASALLALLPKDADNVYVTLCARDLNSKIRIISRTEGEAGESKLRRAGANQIIAPYRVAGLSVVQQLMRPHVSDFLELASSKGGSQIALEEVMVPESSPVIGMTLREAGLFAKTGAFIAAKISPDGNTSYNPGADSVITPGETFIVLGQPDSLLKMNGNIEVKVAPPLR